MNKTLNPKIWENNKLKADVRTKIIDIVNEFKEFADIPMNVLDIQLVGSNANYNYKPNSDIDIHIIINFEEISNNADLMQALMDGKKASFNDTYEIKIKGLEAEIYVEDVKSGAISNGIYSVMQNCWIKFPKKIVQEKPNVDNMTSKYVSKINAIINNTNVTKEQINDLINEIYMLRKNGLAKSGEMSKSNITFKELRDLGLIQKLKDVKNDLISKDLSLEGIISSVNEIF